MTWLPELSSGRALSRTGQGTDETKVSLSAAPVTGAELATLSGSGHPLVLHLTGLLERGEFRQALAGGREHQQRGVGGEKDPRMQAFLLSVQFRALKELGHSGEAVAVAHELLALQRERGWVVAEITTLAEAATTLVAMGGTREATDLLGRAVWLLRGARPAGETYVQAVLALAYSVQNADLYEVCAEILADLLTEMTTGALRELVAGDPLQRYYVDDCYAEMQLVWGMRLAQLQRHDEARSRFGRALLMVQRWAGVPGTDPVTVIVEGLALAKLGRYTEAVALVAPQLASLQPADNRRRIGVCHLVLGICWRGFGDFAAARRELLAADYMWGEVGSPADRQLLEQERVALELAADPLPEAQARLIEAALRHATERVWSTRLDGLAALRQAVRHEQLDSERALLAVELRQDPLTRLGNRRVFDEFLAGLGTLHVVPLSLVLIDIDGFKLVNDTHSHPVGDRVLRAVAAVIRACIGFADVPVRLGGDEFAVFVFASLSHAVSLAEVIRSEVAKADWALISPGLTVTISAGVAEHQADQDGDHVVGVADGLLYQAKRGGRNQIYASPRRAVTTRS